MTLRFFTPAYSDTDILIGRQVHYWGRTWTVVAKNYLGDWDVERFELRDDGRYRICSTISPRSLPESHPHYAEVLPVGSCIPVEAIRNESEREARADRATKPRRDSYAVRLWEKSNAAWNRAHRMLGGVRGNAKNLRRYNRHINESDRLMRKLDRIGALRAPLPAR
jgi:hypothetical protein